MTEERRLVQETAIDHFSEVRINWPNPNATMKFDFLFRKKDEGEWRYLASVDDVKNKLLQAHIETCGCHGGEYRLIASRTGYILQQG